MNKASCDKPFRVRTAPFVPHVIIALGWAFWKGPKDGKGLEGEEDRDKASLALAEVDFANVELITCLEGANLMPSTGEEKLIRLRKLGRTLFGTTVFTGLWQDYQSCQNKAESVLEKLYHQKGITYIDFFGDILRDPYGSRFVLYLYRSAGGSWYWHCRWLAFDWNVRGFTAVAQQVSSS